jgi:spore maturation protein CgeB
MRLVVFGLTVTSSWGNGHATLWRGLIRALAERGHRVTFFERDAPYYAAHRDLARLPWGTLELYDRWDPAAARRALASADAAIVTSYCPDAREATAAVDASGALRVFYDLDTPVTLARLDANQEVEYVPPGGLGGYDLVLSYAGGPAPAALRRRLGARATAPLYGFVDDAAYRPGRPRAEYACDLSHIGTYSADRRERLEELFLLPIRRRGALRLLLAGALYPPEITDHPHVRALPHLAPADHPDFYASSAWTLSVTRGPMAAMGYCPSGRLFEAAACGAAIITDVWAGLERFFAPGVEIVTAGTCDDVLAALATPESKRRAIGEAARTRVLAAHTARHRAAELERLLLAAQRSQDAAVRDGEAGSGAEPGVAAS